MAAGDAVTIEGMLHAPVGYGGLWFADTGCRREFATAANLKADRLASFAKCLAGMQLRRSNRRDSLLDTAVFTYGPGIEIELRTGLFPNAEKTTLEGKLRWIGFVGRHGADDVLPTVTPETLEAVRTEGDRGAEPDASVRATLDKEIVAVSLDHAYAWLKVCIDATGTVTSVRPRDTSSTTMEQTFSAIVRTWRFNPVVLDTQPIPVCSLLRFIYPVSKAPEVETLPVPPGVIRFVQPTALERLRMGGSKNIVPDDDAKMAIQWSGQHQTVTSVKMCLDAEGNVVSLELLKHGISRDYDDKILRVMRTTWKYRPYITDGKPMPVCSAVTFIYSQR